MVTRILPIPRMSRLVLLRLAWRPPAQILFPTNSPGVRLPVLSYVRLGGVNKGQESLRLPSSDANRSELLPGLLSLPCSRSCFIVGGNGKSRLTWFLTQFLVAHSS